MDEGMSFERKIYVNLVPTKSLIRFRFLSEVEYLLQHFFCLVLNVFWHRGHFNVTIVLFWWYHRSQCFLQPRLLVPSSLLTVLATVRIVCDWSTIFVVRTRTRRFGLLDPRWWLFFFVLFAMKAARGHASRKSPKQSPMMSSAATFQWCGVQSSVSVSTSIGTKVGQFVPFQFFRSCTFGSSFISSLNAATNIWMAPPLSLSSPLEPPWWSKKLAWVPHDPQKLSSGGQNTNVNFIFSMFCCTQMQQQNTACGMLSHNDLLMSSFLCWFLAVLHPVEPLDASTNSWCSFSSCTWIEHVLLQSLICKGEPH